jgi:hypothetical protein
VANLTIDEWLEVAQYKLLSGLYCFAGFLLIRRKLYFLSCPHCGGEVHVDRSAWVWEKEFWFPQIPREDCMGCGKQLTSMRIMPDRDAVRYMLPWFGQLVASQDLRIHYLRASRAEQMRLRTLWRQQAEEDNT